MRRRGRSVAPQQTNPSTFIFAKGFALYTLALQYALPLDALVISFAFSTALTHALQRVQGHNHTEPREVDALSDTSDTPISLLTAAQTPESIVLAALLLGLDQTCSAHLLHSDPGPPPPSL